MGTERLVDKSELGIELCLRRLVERYAAAIDRREAGPVRALFTADAHFVVPAVPGSESRSLHVQTEFPSAIGTYLRTLHAIVGFELTDWAEDAATGTTTCIANHISECDRRLLNTVWGFRYHDRFQRVAGVWLFAHRSLEVGWIEERDVAHVRTADGWQSAPPHLA
jgi:SnoaL-like domain